MRGDVAVAGSRFADAPHFSSGAAYVYRWMGTAWALEQKLVPDLPLPGENFAFNAAIDEDVAVFAGNNRCYLFRQAGSSWVQEQILVASDGAPGVSFGSGLSVDGDVAMVAAPDTLVHPNPGVCYAYRRQGTVWLEEQRIEVGNLWGDMFGSSVTVRGDRVAIGSQRAFSVYCLRFDGSAWIQEQTVQPSDGDVEDWFGLDLSIDGDWMVVGAPRKHEARCFQGAVYVFRHDGSQWVQQQKLLAPDAAAEDHFGFSVALSGSFLAVTKPGPFLSKTFLQEVYLFEYDGITWKLDRKLHPSSGSAEEDFAAHVALDGRRLWVGAPGAKGLHPLDELGATYAYDVHGLALAASARTVAAGDVLALTSCSGEPETPGILFMTQFSGIPVFRRLAVRLFDPQGIWGISEQVPFSPNAEVHLRLLSVGVDGAVTRSNDVIVTFE
jgi:hypothetical protein